MQSKALDTSNSPLTREQAEHLNRLVTALAPEQLSWVSGYLAGLHSAIAGNDALRAPGPTGERQTLTILYGPVTGNAVAVARQDGERPKARGPQLAGQDMAAQ